MFTRLAGVRSRGEQISKRSTRRSDRAGRYTDGVATASDPEEIVHDDPVAGEGLSPSGGAMSVAMPAETALTTAATSQRAAQRKLAAVSPARCPSLISSVTRRPPPAVKRASLLTDSEAARASLRVA
jgi:hypothetical protein